MTPLAVPSGSLAPPSVTVRLPVPVDGFGATVKAAPGSSAPAGSCFWMVSRPQLFGIVIEPGLT